MSNCELCKNDNYAKIAMTEYKLKEKLSPLFNVQKLSFSMHCKVYNDGSHFVAVEKRNCFRPHNKNNENLEERHFFNKLYNHYQTQGVKKKQIPALLKDTVAYHFPKLEKIDEFIDENIKRVRHNYFSRVKRLKRKANLNIWNKWVTITYDPTFHDETTFRNKLRKCLSNLHSRRNWKYMGVFERAPETNRLHFHAIMYIPKDEMIGEINEKKDYSTTQHKMQITHSNSFFENKFGRNDFVDLSDNEIKNGSLVEYLTKYIGKTNEKIVYSRGIPSELELCIDKEDIASEYIDYCVKYVIFDDCMDNNGTYMPLKKIYKEYKQSDFFDLLPCQSI